MIASWMSVFLFFLLGAGKIQVSSCGDETDHYRDYADKKACSASDMLLKHDFDVLQGQIYGIMGNNEKNLC